MKRSKELENAVTDLLNLLEIPYIRIDNYRCFKCGQVQNSRAKGFPDFYCYTINLAIECKTGAGRLTKEQEVIKAQMEGAGIRYIVLKNNVDELLKYFKNRGYL